MDSVSRQSFTGNWGKGMGGADATNCYVKAPSQYRNQGCAIINDQAATFGAPFNAQGGGVIATAWDAAGIRAYSWPRGKVPADLTARADLNETGWGLPYARFEFGDECAPSHFHDHQIIFDLTLCGDWAGATFAQACADISGDCEGYISNPANVQEAFWLVNYVDVWQDEALAVKHTVEPRDKANLIPVESLPSQERNMEKGMEARDLEHSTDAALVSPIDRSNGRFFGPPHRQRRGPVVR